MYKYIYGRYKTSGDRLVSYLEFRCRLRGPASLLTFSNAQKTFMPDEVVTGFRLTQESDPGWKRSFVIRNLRQNSCCKLIKNTM